MQATIQYIKDELSAYYPETEIQSLIRLIIEYVCCINYTEFVLKKNDKLDLSVKSKVEKIVRRLKHLEPIQYILGETEFYEMLLKVTPAVLIPRPETEELIQWIIEQNKLFSPSILDIGTGSGCISLALKKHISNANVTAVDISSEALKIARINASKHNLNIDFLEADILSFENYHWKLYDVVISNPPYVRELEKRQMSGNVLQYEPSDALFVPDNDPLVFYIRIAEFSKEYLKKDGVLFVEINEKFGEQLTNLFREYDFKDIELKKDINGRERFVKCTRQ